MGILTLHRGVCPNLLAVPVAVACAPGKEPAKPWPCRGGINLGSKWSWRSGSAIPPLEGLGTVHAVCPQHILVEKSAFLAFQDCGWVQSSPMAIMGALLEGQQVFCFCSSAPICTPSSLFPLWLTVLVGQQHPKTACLGERGCMSKL